MKNVHLQYFALLRDQRGLARETRTTAAATASELYNELVAQYKFTLPAKQLKVAVNDEFAPWETALRDGDRVVFMPPMAGG